MADTHFVAEKMRLSEPITIIWIKIDPYYQQQKCRPVTLVSGGMRTMRIFAKVPWGGSVKRQQGCRQRQFSAFSLAIFSDTLEMRPALLYGDTQSAVGFSVIPKSLNDLEIEWLFRVKFCFLRRFGWLWLCDFRKIIAWKLINIYRHIYYSGANLRQGL